MRGLDEEMNPAAYGTPSVQSFTDGFLEGTEPNAVEFRAYRIRVLNE